MRPTLNPIYCEIAFIMFSSCIIRSRPNKINRTNYTVEHLGVTLMNDVYRLFVCLNDTFCVTFNDGSPAHPSERSRGPVATSFSRYGVGRLGTTPAGFLF